MMYQIEKQFSSVTPKQAQFYIEMAIKKIDPKRIISADVEGVVRGGNWISNYKREAVNGIITITDYTQREYKRINYNPDGNGGIVDYESRFFEYKDVGYKTTSEQTDEPDFTEIYRDKPGDYQFYRKDASGVYNIICEFDFHSDTKGTCYYYEIDTVNAE